MPKLTADSWLLIAASWDVMQGYAALPNNCKAKSCSVPTGLVAR